MGDVFYIWGDEEIVFAYLDSIEDIKKYFKMGMNPREVLDDIEADFEDDEERPNISEAQIKRYGERLGVTWKVEYRIGEPAKIFPFDKLNEAIRNGEVKIEFDK